MVIMAGKAATAALKGREVVVEFVEEDLRKWQRKGEGKGSERGKK